MHGEPNLVFLATSGVYSRYGGKRGGARLAGRLLAFS